jgi:tetratricopeptide (TPR) repeat protein
VPGWVEAAVAAFRRAIDLDDAWRFAEQSLVLDPLLAEGHAIAGLLLSDKDPVGAEKYLRRALELDPTSGTACNWLAIALYNQGRMAESGAAQDKGLETFEQQTKVTYPDIPPSAAKDLGWLNILAGNYSFGIELLEPDVNIESLEGLAPFFINRGLQELERLHALVFAYEKVGRDDAARGLLL